MSNINELNELIYIEANLVGDKISGPVRKLNRNTKPG